MSDDAPASGSVWRRDEQTRRVHYCKSGPLGPDVYWSDDMGEWYWTPWPAWLEWSACARVVPREASRLTGDRSARMMPAHDECPSSNTYPCSAAGDAGRDAPERLFKEERI